MKECPTIGQEIESFVQEANIGADAWRRTGVLTFDGNTRVKAKVTYERIRQHLMKVYQRKFSFGTVVQLCIARNKRRLSASRYKGVAKVTSRRARKGFMLKFNPDAHWSSALYRSLNHLQYQDGRHILNVNRDDAAGFRLDTMTTHRLHRTSMVQDSLQPIRTMLASTKQSYKPLLITSPERTLLQRSVLGLLNRLVFFPKILLSIWQILSYWRKPLRLGQHSSTL